MPPRAPPNGPVDSEPRTASRKGSRLGWTLQQEEGDQPLRVASNAPSGGEPPARELSGARTLDQPADHSGLAGVLQVVGDDADQAHAEGDRRVPRPVDDAGILVVRQVSDV